MLVQKSLRGQNSSTHIDECWPLRGQNGSTHIDECWPKNHQENYNRLTHTDECWQKKSLQEYNYLTYRNECILKNHYYYKESFPYQLIQKELPSEELIVNLITNSADKSPENYRKGFLTKLCKKIGHQPM